MLSPEPSNVLRSGAKAFSPANGDPRFSRTTPDAHLARIEEAEAADASGSTKVWAGRILRDRSRKAPVYSDGRKQMLQLMQGRAVAAEQRQPPNARRSQPLQPFNWRPQPFNWRPQQEALATHSVPSRWAATPTALLFPSRSTVLLRRGTCLAGRAASRRVVADSSLRYARIVCTWVRGSVYAQCTARGIECQSVYTLSIPCTIISSVWTASVRFLQLPGQNSG